MRLAILSALTFCVSLVPTLVVAAPAGCYDWILREKMRAGYLAANDPREVVVKMKAVGMNAVLPKFGGLTTPPNARDLRLLEEWGAAAEKAGIHCFPVFNFRGSETEKLLSARREVTGAGECMKKTPCPLDEQFWRTYIFRRAVDLASRAKELHLAGAIIDPEMYGADHTIFAKPCYCDDCLKEFLRALGQTAPQAFPDARADWLKERHLADRFEQYVTQRVRGFCVEIERAVHRQAPGFLLGVFLLDYPHPFMRGMAQGLGTPEYPVLGFSETTYVPGYTRYIEEQQKTFAALPSQVLFLPGLWLSQFPCENLAEQFYACARHSSGYWIYTLESLVEDVSKKPGYELREANERYWSAAQTADAELDRLAAGGGKYESPLKVRPYDAPLPVLVTGDIKLGPLEAAIDRKPISLGAETFPKLRYRNPLCILARAGEPVEVKITNQPLNSIYRFGTQYVVLDAQGKQVAEGNMKLGQNAIVRWTPAQDGVCVVVADSGQNGYKIQVLTKQPFAFQATGPKQALSVIGHLGRLYFYVPQGMETLTLFAKAEGHLPGRGGKLAVIAPDGQVAVRIAGDLGSLAGYPVKIPPALQDRVWAISGEDLTNELKIHFSPASVSYLGTDPARLLRAK